MIKEKFLEISDWFASRFMPKTTLGWIGVIIAFLGVRYLYMLIRSIYENKR